MATLGPGNQINYWDSYSGESVELFRGWKSFNLLGLAVVDPSRPSRNIPFVIPSRQKGRPHASFNLQPNQLVYRIGLKAPKEIIWSNTTNHDPGDTFANAAVTSDVKVVYEGPQAAPGSEFLNVSINPNRYTHRREFDTSIVHQAMPGSSLVFYEERYQTSTTPNNSNQAIDRYFEAIQPSQNYGACPKMTIDNNFFIDDVINPATVKLSLAFSSTVPAPTTIDGKKSAFILEVSGFMADFEMPDSTKAFSGFDEIN